MKIKNTLMLSILLFISSAFAINWSLNGDIYIDIHENSCANTTADSLCVKLGKKLYRFSAQELNWHEASHFCHREKGRLLTLENENELKIISDYAEANFAEKSQLRSWFWIGINRVGTEEFYATETGLPKPFVKWGNGEPNSVNGGEECVHFWYEDGLKMNDHRCEVKTGFICEFDYSIRKMDIKIHKS